jgi:hypothetical protein
MQTARAAEALEALLDELRRVIGDRPLGGGDVVVS